MDKGGLYNPNIPPLETESGDINNGREGSGEVSSLYARILTKTRIQRHE